MVKKPARNWRSHLVAGLLAVTLAITGAAPAGALLGFPPPPPPPPPVKVIVQQWRSGDTTVADFVRFLGGTVTRPLPIIGGFAATIPEGAVTSLASYAGVRAVTFDSAVQPQDLPADGGAPSVHREVVAAPADPSAPAGEGVTVAVIDTGISSVPDLADNIRPVVNSSGATVPCMNFSSETTCADSYGHGTFVAGLIAGDGVRKGIAPKADLLSVKLSGRDGTSSVSQLLAAIQWVVENRQVYDVEVLNLSLKVASTLSYRIDPVNLAVEQAWAAGIVVVVSAGNQGAGPQTIAKPADDPWVIAVGSTDDQGTAAIGDDVVSSFSSRGPTLADGLAKPDLVVPGRSLVSLRAPGSAADVEHPAFVDGTYRRGTGTSFSAPIVAGAAAVLRSADPAATNDRIKFALLSTARPLAGVPATDQGAGVVDVTAALSAGPGQANTQLFHPLLFPFGVASSADTFGSVWAGVVYEGGNWQGGNWQGGNWQGGNWQGGNWQGGNWQGGNWQGGNWQGGNWQGGNWQSNIWQGGNWQGGNWQGGNWQGGNWQGGNWQGGNWQASDWQGGNWQGGNWQSQYWI